MAVINCDDKCLLTLDQGQLVDLYDMLNDKVRADLQDDYDCKKINGATYADTWAKMMSPAIGHIMGALVTLATKETAADRAVKASQVDLNDANATRLVCSCTNETNSTNSKTALNTAQATKLVCDCTNQTALRNADVALKGRQGALYDRQAKGFDDNANQKLFDSQLSAWSMVYADADIVQVTSPLQDSQICESYTRIRSNLGGPTSNCAPIAVEPTV